MEGRALRPLGVGEALDASFNLYFRNLGLLLRIAAAVVVPVIALSAILLLVGIQETDGSNPNAALYEIASGEIRLVDEQKFLILSAIAAVLGALAYLVAIAALFRAISERYIGRGASARESLAAGAKRAHSVLWIFVIIGVAFFLLVIPAAATPLLAVIFTLPLIVFLLVRWCVAIPALMVEQKKGSKALGRSFELVENRWLATFGVLIVGVIFILLLELLVSLAGEGLGSLASEQTMLYIVLLSLMNGIGTIVTAPFQAAIVTVIYYDLRVRKEAFDVELLTEQLEAPAIGGPPPPPPAQTPGDPPPPPPPSTPSGW
ncbi:MAG TPA: glycerophosphoryl diester phosphodiesterase membrane domain-containing protein [Solirubrobacterales bacterium]|nr:glycerophosphoryl diester phosphodiesterase membrane domain-containing protein [Solirubrobacterales bacterium]